MVLQTTAGMTAHGVFTCPSHSRAALSEFVLPPGYLKNSSTETNCRTPNAVFYTAGPSPGSMPSDTEVTLTSKFLLLIKTHGAVWATVNTELTTNTLGFVN
jgi:hypothetical protein